MPSTPRTAPTCRRCGSPIPSSGLGEACPRCLLRQVIDSGAGEGEASAGADARTPASDRPPAARCFGDYELLGEIARGGMGVVHRARQVSLNRVVALKMIAGGQLSSPQVLERFRIEAETAARLDHPGIVPIHEIGEHEGQCFYSMKLLDGGDLRQRLEALGRAPAPERNASAARLVARVARAIHHAHQHGVLHRDLKPSNILLDRDGEPHVADFGLAKLLGEDSSLTRSTAVLGTPAYMAPEQAAGKAAQATVASDVYSLGAILFELLTGRPPFLGATALETLRLAVETEPPRPRSLRADVDRDLETVCLRCLARDPGRRYASALAFAEDLERWMRGDPILARPTSGLEVLWKWCRRKPVVAALAAAVLLLVVALTGGAIVAAALYRGQRDSAVQNQTRAEQAERDRSRDLFRSYLAQARVGRLTGGNGLELVRRARALLAPGALPEAELLELRDEAIACLATPSAQVEAQWKLPAATSRLGAAFDGDRLRFALIGSDGVVTIRSAADGAVEMVIPSPAPPPSWHAVGQFAAGGGRLLVQFRVSGGNGALVGYVWDLEGRNWLLSFQGFGIAALDLAGTKVAVADGEGSVRILEVPGGRELDRLTVDPGLAVLVFDPAGERVGWHQDRKAVILDVRLRRQTAALEAPEPLQSLAWSPRGDRVALGSSSGEAQVLDVELRSTLSVMRGHESDVVGLAFHPGGDWLCSGSWDGTSRIWDSWTGRELLRLPGDILGFAGDGRRFGFFRGETYGLQELGDHGAVRALHPTFSRRSTIWTSHQDTTDADFSPDGRLVAGATGGGAVLWDSGTGREAARLEIGYVETVRFDPGGRWLWTFGELGLFRWMLTHGPAGSASLELGPPESRDVRGRNSWQQMSLDADGRWIAYIDRASLEEDGQARVTVFDCESGAIRWQRGVASSITRAVLSPDGRWLVLIYWKHRSAQVGSLEGGGKATNLSRRADLPENWVLSAAFSPDGRTLVLGCGAEYLGFRVGDWEPTFVLPREPAQMGMAPAAFSPRGDLLAIAREARAVDLIEAATGRRLATLASPHSQTITCLRFSPDGSQVAAATTGRDVQLWSLTKTRVALAGLALEEGFPDVAPAAGDRTVEVRAVGVDKAFETFASFQGYTARLRAHELTKTVLTKGPGAAAEVQGSARDWVASIARSPLRQPEHLARLTEDSRRRWLDSLAEMEKLSQRVAANCAAPLRPAILGPLAAPAPDAAVSLESSPFAVASGESAAAGALARHVWSRWQVRAAGSKEEDDPLFEALRMEELTRCPLPLGLLLPGSSYLARVAHITADGQVSPWSEEARIDVGGAGDEAIPFDLAAACNQDVVFAPGDAEDDELDPGSGGDRPLVPLDGYDGERQDNPAVRGLPRDRRLGPYRLGDPAAANVIQIAQSGAPIRVAIPPRRYRALRFLLTGGWGTSRLAIALESPAGERTEVKIHCNDWTNDFPPAGSGPIIGSSWPVRRGLDEVRRRRWTDSGRAALFEAIVATDPASEIAAIVFEPAGSAFTMAGLTRANVFAITGVAVR